MTDVSMESPDFPKAPDKAKEQIFSRMSRLEANLWCITSCESGIVCFLRKKKKKAEKLYLSPYLPGIGWTEQEHLPDEARAISFPKKQLDPMGRTWLPFNPAGSCWLSSGISQARWQPWNLGGLRFQCICSNVQARKTLSVEYERGRYKRLNIVSSGKSWWNGLTGCKDLLNTAFSLLPHST